MLRCFMDYQNAYKVFKRESQHIQGINIGDLVDEIAETVGEESAPMHRGFSGIHTREENQTSRDRMIKLTTALKYKQRFEFYLTDLAYIENDDGYLEAREKGIDVRIACELMAAAMDPAVSSVLLWSNDQDLAEAVQMAKQLTKASGKAFEIYCIHTDNTRPVRGGVPFHVTKTMLYRHRRWSEERAEQCEKCCAVEEDC